MRLKRFAVVLGLLSSAAGAQEFNRRADDGDRAVATEIGQAYLERLGPALASALDACAQNGQRSVRGDTITFIARVTRDGTLSALESDPPTSQAQCLRERLVSARLSPPSGWNWERGDFPLTLRVGFGTAARTATGG